MARTIAEIKQEMTDEWMGDCAVRERYGLTASDTFDGSFSRVSLEGLLFYIVAFGIWALEKLFDSHKSEVSAMLEAQRPHSVRWYQEKALAFRPPNSDDTPVRYCSVDDRGCRLKIKVAGGDAGARQPIGAAEAEALSAYLDDEKDAGLKIEIVNENNNALSARLKVWYDPMRLVPSAKPVEAALREYVSNLDFDGLLSRNGIVDAVRSLAGVEMVKIEQLRTKYADNTWRDFGEQERAESGYWTVGATDASVVYERYRKENL